MKHIVTTDVLDNAYKQALLRMWNNEYPAQLALADVASLDEYLAGLEHVMHYLLVEDGQVLVWAETFSREGMRWFAIIADKDAQGKGYGRQMMVLLMEKEPILNGWVTDHDRYVKIDGTPYASPIGFYKRLGFEVRGERLETDKLSAVRIVWMR